MGHKLVKFAGHKKKKNVHGQCDVGFSNNTILERFCQLALNVLTLALGHWAILIT